MLALRLRVEGGVLDLVDMLEGDESADRQLGEPLAAKQLAEQLQQAADRLVVALAARDERVRRIGRRDVA
jgi:hypothetical protein